jgi:two-component system NarL family sensor kinase
VPSAPQAIWSLFVAGVLSVGIVLVALGAALILAQRRRLAMQQDFARRLLAAQEDERARIAREVHDDALQRVAMIGHEVDDLATTLPGNGADVARRARAIATELQDLGVMLRSVAHQLHPSLVEQVGLARALQALGTEFSRTTGLVVDVSVTGADVPLRPDVGLAAYRIAQESLRNVVRHAQTERVTVELEANEDTVRLRVRDSGRGLPAGRRTESGLGLRAMRERAELVKGRLAVTSAPGSGTTVEAVLPRGDG